MGVGTPFVPGPVLSGNSTTSYGQAGSDQGPCILMQTGTITHNGTSAVDLSFVLPAYAQIIDLLPDTTTAWTSATSDTLSIGTASGGTQYASGIDTKSAGRVRPTFTAAQLTAMANIGTNTTVVATVTPVGTAAAGVTRVTLVYAQIPETLTSA